MDKSACKVCPPVFTFSNVLISDATKTQSVAFVGTGRQRCKVPRIDYNAVGKASQTCRSSRITDPTSVPNVATRSCACVGVFGPAAGSATSVARGLLELVGFNASQLRSRSFVLGCSSDARAIANDHHSSFSAPSRRPRRLRVRRQLPLNSFTRVEHERRKARLVHGACMVQCVAGSTKEHRRCCRNRD